jgi:alpha-L-fucosidase 2
MKLLPLLLAIPLVVAAAPEPMRLTLEAPIAKWDEAIPLGNGLLGGLLWGQGNELRLSLDRGDLWDLRQHPIYARPEFNYATVVAHAQSGRTDALNTEFARPSDFPTKLPGARLVVTLAPELQARAFHLDLLRALGSVDFGSASAECFFSETSPAALLLLPDPAAKFDLIPNPAVKKIGYALASVSRSDREVTLVQDAAEGFRYVIHVASRPAGGRTLLALALTTNRESADPVALAHQHVTAALERGFDAARAEHVQRWEKFWARSSVSLPDAALQQHYNLVQYFYGAASRRGAPPIPLQGLWTADAGVLPPWRGDYHHDLNTQLTYWAYLASGHFDQGLSFLDFMWGLKPGHEQFARDFFGVKQGIIVPGVMALDGRAMGSWFPYTLSPTMSAWVAQSFYWHWRYEMDPRFLADRAYPYCAAIGEALAALLKPDARTGLLKLPLSSSPEIHNNTQRAWLPPHSNFDHALLQWLFLANAEMATALNRGPEADRWRALHARLGPLAVSDTGVLLVAPGEALSASHRHHSQLMAIHPLGLLHPENSADDRRIVDATLADVDRLGTSAWTGYSFSWMAALRARVGRGDEALRFLSAYREHTTSRNGFHLNGVITGSKISNYRGRAFTLEGNFAAAQAVHEMLLQGDGRRLRLFPALPSTWREASFRDLRAEGGFVVSAEVRDGRVRRATIRATVDQDLRLADPFPGREYEASLPLQRVAGELRGGIRAGQTVELRERPAARTVTYDPAALPQGREYFTLRAGLPHARAKFSQGKTGRVAFLGGSITAMSGWRELVMQDLQRRFPRTEFDFIGAGIGSLGSVPHAFRLERDVFSRGPVDLLFVEAAVNDASNIPDRPDLMLRGLEGVVRHARLAQPDIDIVHLHFVMPDHMEAYGQGREPIVIAQHEKVAVAYGNPSLDLAREVTERIAAGQFTWADDFKNLHPSPFGHQVYAHSIARLFDAAFSGPAAASPAPQPLPAAPLDPGSYFRGRFGSLSDIRILSGFTREAAWRPSDGKSARAGFVDAPAIVGTQPGAEFEFTFEGTGAGLFVAAGPDAGVIEFSVDGGATRTADTFTRWSRGLHLPWAVILDDQLAPGRHTVRVRLAGTRNPASTGTALRVFHLLLN